MPRWPAPRAGRRRALARTCIVAARRAARTSSVVLVRVPRIRRPNLVRVGAMRTSEPEPEPEPERERPLQPKRPELMKAASSAGEQREVLVPVLSQKNDAVQQLCVRWGFGPPSATSIRAPCGLMAVAVARWLASASISSRLAAACADGGGGLPTVMQVLAPLQSEEVLLPLLDRTAAELLPRREQYIEAHPDEFESEDAQQSYRRGLVGPFEISSWLRDLPSAAVVAPVVFLRNVQCGPSAEDRPSARRIWSDFATLNQDKTVLAIERDYVKTEGTTPMRELQLPIPRLPELQCRPASVRFLVESVSPSTSEEAVTLGGQGVSEPRPRHTVQTLEEWLLSGLTTGVQVGRRPQCGTVIVVESETHRGSKTQHHYHCSWGHFAVLLYLDLCCDGESGGDTLLLLDSMPVDDLPTSPAQAVFEALTRIEKPPQ
eukprot:COSAG02_NODE_9751_length_2120_cov_4.115784_1_plen_432_part_00